MATQQRIWISLRFINTNMLCLLLFYSLFFLLQCPFISFPLCSQILVILGSPFQDTSFRKPSLTSVAFTHILNSVWNMLFDYPSYQTDSHVLACIFQLQVFFFATLDNIRFWLCFLQTFLQTFVDFSIILLLNSSVISLWSVNIFSMTLII